MRRYFYDDDDDDYDDNCFDCRERDDDYEPDWDGNLKSRCYHCALCFGQCYEDDD